MIYDNLVKNLNNKANIDNKVYFHFVRGAFLEIKGSRQAEYDIKFINNKIMIFFFFMYFFYFNHIVYALLKSLGSTICNSFLALVKAV
jgi:hypothetical protein